MKGVKLVLTADQLVNCSNFGNFGHFTLHRKYLLGDPGPATTSQIEKQTCSERKENGSMVHIMGCWIMIGECTFALLRSVARPME